MTIDFPQVSKAAAKAKMKRLVGNTLYGRIGFCDIRLHITSDADFKITGQREYTIQLSSTYHVESTMREMYRTNGKKW